MNRNRLKMQISSDSMSSRGENTERRRVESYELDWVNVTDTEI